MLAPLSAESLAFARCFFAQADEDALEAFGTRLQSKNGWLFRQLDIEDAVFAWAGLNYDPILRVKAITILACERQYETLRKPMPCVSLSAAERLMAEMQRLHRDWLKHMLVHYRPLQPDYLRLLPHIAEDDLGEALKLSGMHALRMLDMATAL